MKNLLTAILLLSTLLSNAQEIRKVRKVVTVIKEQDFYLNGGMRAAFGGKSRTSILVTLPPNTIEWYYTFTTAEGEKPNPNGLKLASQLATLFDPTGITSLAAATILSPSGSNVCDVYLLDKANSEAFLNKVDLNGGKYYHTAAGSRENFRNATVQISQPRQGSFFLGFKNPSTTTGIAVTLEVAAIVEETIVNGDVWTNTGKDRLFNSFYRNIKNKKLDDAIAKDLANCLVTKISESKTPKQYDEMGQGERDVWINTLYAGCTEPYKETKSPEQEKATTYGSLGWRSFENGDVDKCIEYSKKALDIDSTMGWVKTNLGLCYLIKGDESAATELYLEALLDFKRLKNSVQSKYYLQATVKDIEAAQRKYPIMKGHEDIKSLYAGELKNR